MVGVSIILLSSKLEEAGLGARADDYIPIFQGVIDM
jgi:hypothetical protein